jgi:nucleotide-binding universal stress UspA family protein
MFETIVVGSDGSETASEAVRQAFELVRGQGRVLHVVSAYRPASAQVVTVGSDEWDILPQDRVDSVLQDVASRARIEGAKVETHAIRGDPAAAIIRVAKEVGADLVVVGNKGMKGAKRFLLGSVPNKVAHSAPCAVLIIKTT